MYAHCVPRIDPLIIARGCQDYETATQQQDQYFHPANISQINKLFLLGEGERNNNFSSSYECVIKVFTSELS
jgi:hypothetical protein